MSERPKLNDLWDSFRGAVPVYQMDRGMEFNIAWSPPWIATWEPVEASCERVVYLRATFKIVRGPFGRVLMGKWSDETEWRAVTYEQ